MAGDDMAEGLTAADLARWEELAGRCYSPPWESFGGESVWADGIWLADGHDENMVSFIAASREAVPALVATVRDLARAIVGAEECGAGFFVGVKSCPFCDSGLDNGTIVHMDNCIMHTAKTLTDGDGGKYAYLATLGDA